MSDMEHEPMGPVEHDEIEPIPEEPGELTTTKPKRHMSEKQLANLAKAREKAKVALTVKKKRSTTLKQQERKLRELKLKEKEDRVQAELNTLQNTVNVDGDAEDEPVRHVRKPTKKKKPPKIVYYSSSEEDDEPEPEIIYKKKPKAKPRTNFQKMPTMREADKAVEDAAIEQKYNDELLRMRRDYMMQQVFPS